MGLLRKFWKEEFTMTLSKEVFDLCNRFYRSTVENNEVYIVK